MTPGRIDHDPFLEMASLYALGALSPTEQARFEMHLNEPCPVCKAELSSFERVTGELSGLSESEPPPHLKQRLMERIGEAPRKAGVLLADRGLLIARAAEMPWRTMSPGIEFKPLYIDRERAYSSLLVRMEAGASYPDHRHADIEELFVLSGELNVAGHVMRAGDYCRAETGSQHGVTFSDTGCMIILIASQRNEMLA